MGAPQIDAPEGGASACRVHALLTTQLLSHELEADHSSELKSDRGFASSCWFVARTFPGSSSCSFNNETGANSDSEWF